jgi:hypothetical protein
MKNKIIQYSILIFIIFSLFDTKLLSQQVYFVENQSAKVQKSDYDGNNLSLLITSVLGLYGIATDISNNKIYYTNVVNDEIKTAGLDGSSPTVLLNSSHGINGPRGIAIDGVNNKIYWAEVISGKIKKADFNGANIVEVLTGLSSPVDVALDLVNNKLYWSDNGVGQKKIRRSNLDGTSPEDIITGLDQVSGIEVDAENGKLYWVDFGATDKISRSNTNGSSPEALITVVSGSPRGIAVDKGSDKLFWSDVLSSSISSANRNGTSSSGILSSLSHPIGISTNWTLALPVELTAFLASVVNKTVELIWETATEVNNYGFEIERASSLSDDKAGSSTPMHGWKKIGFVEGHGNSNSLKNYSFTDNDVVNGKYTYRLKQIDTDGKFEYSKEVTVTIENTPSSFELSQNYPNPFNPTTKISWQSPVSSWQTLKVYDVLGNEVATLVNEHREAGSYEVEFDASKLSSGTYLFKLQSGSFVETKKMTLLR